MDILVYLVPLALLLAGVFVFAFRWATRTDQFEDLETPAIRILLDDDKAEQTPSAQIREDQDLNKSVVEKKNPST